MKEIVERCGGRCVTVDDPWGRAVDPQKVEEALRKHPGARLVAFVHAETSTGARSDARALAMIAREKGALVVADTVTSLGGIPLEVDAWGIDAAYSGSQKCLSCTPGLSPVTFSERALAKAAGRKTPVQSWFLDVNLVRAYWEGGTRRAYHHTAPINPLYGLHEALVILQEEGLEAAWDRHERIHRILRAGLERLGLEFFVPEKERLPHLNAVTVPEGVSESEVRARLLEEYGLEIGAGLGPLAGKIWRIGAMGRACHAANAALCLHALERVLKSLYRGAAP